MVGRTMLRGTTVWRPTDPVIAASAWRQLSILLRTQQALTPNEVALAGLVNAAHLGAVVLEGTDRRVRAHLQRVVGDAGLPLRSLLTEAQTLIGTEVLAKRM